MVRRGPPPKGHKARARKGVAVAGGRAARIAAASAAPRAGAHRPPQPEAEPAAPGPGGSARSRRSAVAPAGDDAAPVAKAARRTKAGTSTPAQASKAARPVRRKATPDAATTSAKADRGPPHPDDAARSMPADDTPPRQRRNTPAAPAPAPRASARRRAAARPPEPPPLPGKTELRAFLDRSTGRVRKSDIARHFGLTSDQRPALRALIREIAAEGGASPAGKRAIIAPDKLPEIAPVEITGTDPDGDPIARPLQWQGEGRPPIIYMHPEPRGQRALTAGERVLARLKPIGPGKYEGRTFKRIAGAPPARILGVFEEGRIIPTDRRQKGIWEVPRGEEGGARPGEIVLAEPLPSTRHFGAKPARIVERLGVMGEPRSVSLVCIHAHGIPDVFPAEAVQQAERAVGVSAQHRTDLRDIPLVTIDGEDARDFDDAVFAEPDGDGWRILVAIADVAHYVTPNSPLDREAWARGNSVYFPDRVVPMLPEALSNGWCSLRPNEDRGCLFVEMRFDAQGRKHAHSFGRGIMRSVARLTYEQVQAAADALAPMGGPDGADPTTPARAAAAAQAKVPSPADTLPEGHITRLYGAFRALLGARIARGTLDLDVPERKVVLDSHGRVAEVAPRARLDSHRLIEEFMVAANVCAAEELERLSQPCMYRVHDRPSDQKLEGLRQFLATFDITLPQSDRLHPRDFARVLDKVRGHPQERLVNESVLRGQSQAAYAPDNLGHFGLALPRYAHFTSPIRRYADLLVHRALIRGMKLGADGLQETEAARFPETAEHITSTERRAAAAERDAVDRYLAAFMATRIGESFEARISGVTRFGLFVTLEENGASGLVPLQSLPDDRWDLDEATQTLAGRRTRLTFSLGQSVEARLAEATPRTGGMVFHILQGLPAGGRKRPVAKGRSRGRH
jgi:ribonuclease R